MCSFFNFSFSYLLRLCILVTRASRNAQNVLHLVKPQTHKHWSMRERRAPVHKAKCLRRADRLIACLERCQWCSVSWGHIYTCIYSYVLTNAWTETCTHMRTHQHVHICVYNIYVYTYCNYSAHHDDEERGWVSPFLFVSRLHTR